jgi:uncharacterized protein YfaS (alpha-2-macroglobulin family)
MRRLRVRLGFIFVLVILVGTTSPPIATQTADLRVLEAAPNGAIQQLSDANEIRVIFSEPMVALGRVPSNPAPAWIHIAPTIKGSFRWSGTTILIFTPDAASPLPFATHYVVTIDRTAESAEGHRLGASYQFAFTTPTVKLMSAEWSRQTTRFDSPVAIALTFNQPVRPADVLAHTTVRYEPHDWSPPTFSTDDRARLQAADPDGLRRFDAKVAATTQVTRSARPVAVRLALNWNRDRFGSANTLVVFETTTPPPPESWLRIVVDASMPSPDGAATPGSVQTTTNELDHALFVARITCVNECAPSRFNAVEFSTVIPVQAFALALTVRDITDPAHEADVTPKSAVRPAGQFDNRAAHSVEDAGFDRQPPARTWRLRLASDLTSEDGQTLGYPWIGSIENWHDVAFTSFGDGHGVWEKDGGPQLPFYARNVQAVTEWLLRLTPADLMPRIIALEKGAFGDTPARDGTNRRLRVIPDAVESHGFDLTTSLSAQGTGLFWAAMKDGDPIAKSKPAEDDVKPHSTLVQVTNLGITVKDSPLSTLVFVTRLDNGAPVADARVGVVSRANKAIWTGRTGRDGVALAPALQIREPPSPGRGDEDAPSVQYLVTAEKDGDVAYAVSNWDEGIEPWAFGLNYGLWESTPVLRGSVFTDRGVYRPGEDVHFKVIARSDTPTGMRLLGNGTAVEVDVTDSRDRTVDHRLVKVNHWSGADWTWTVPASGTVGDYQIAIHLPKATPTGENDLTRSTYGEDWLQTIHGSFLVAAYRRPDFRVDATASIDEPVAGHTIRATLEARYLFGSAMAKRPVRWTLSHDADYGVPASITDRQPWKTFRFGYYPDTAQRRSPKAAAEDATLDANGTLTLDLPTDRTVDFAYRYTFEGEVEDASRQRIANRADIVVYPAPWFVGLRQPDYFVDPKRGTSVDVVVVDREGAPVVGVPVKLSLVHVQWNSVRHAEGHGFYSWETQRIEKPAGEWTITSTAAPQSQAIPIPEGGFFVLRAMATDTAGHTARTEDSFYGVGDGYTAWERFDNNRIKFEPERATWKPGETARLMIQSPWESATALLTVEREGIRSYRQFALTSTQQTVDVPVSEADIPNVYVSILLVRGRSSTDVGKDGDDPGKPAFRLGYAELKVEDATKHLGVKVTADRDEYRPANTAKVAVTVNDAAGKGAASEVTLWAVDYGVLSLTGYSTPDVLSSVWTAKALQVATVDSRQRIISRRVLTPKGETDGGGGGRDGGPGGVRKDFRPLAFWLGSLETDKSGKATTSVTLPESLTTYRIMAVADDAASRFGSAAAEIRVSKPVTIVPALPRFLTMGDRASFGAVITNTTTAGGSAVVTARSLDPAILEFDGGGQSRHTMTLGAGASDAARFAATAHKTGTARVEMTVTLGANSDAFQTTLPVTALTPLEMTAAFGDTDGKASVPLVLPTGAMTDLGGLQVDFASTALVGLGEGVRYLNEYGFDCAEQKGSRALALLLAADLGQAFSMGRVAAADYRNTAIGLLAELPSYQCPDGGFTVWPGLCHLENAYLTAYILDVMKTSNGLGAPIDQKVVGDALDYLDRVVKAPTPRPMPVQMVPGWGAANAYAVKVLTMYGRNEDSNITRLTGVADRLPVFALSYLADALGATKDRGPRYQGLVARITNALRIEGDQAHAEELDTDTMAWLWDSNVRASAVVLDGFVRRGDDRLFVERLVRWLLAARVQGRWPNTQDNISALRALVAYYKAFEAEPPDMTASAAIGSTLLGTATFKGRSTTTQSVRLSMRDLVDRLAGPSPTPDLVLSRVGTGRLYYTARLASASLDSPPPMDRGMTVERHYEKYVENGTSPAATSFDAGDLVRVTLTITVPKERRFVAVTDPLPAGFEPVDGWFRTTASDLARDASTLHTDDSAVGWQDWWRHGGFDNVEKYDDRVIVFGTRLGEGRHEFSYIVRATTAGTFKAAGPEAEEMYAPEVQGRAAATTVIIK